MCLFRVVLVAAGATVIRYLEFERKRKLPNNVYYVDLGRPTGGSIPHNGVPRERCELTDQTYGQEGSPSRSVHKVLSTWERS